MFSGGEFFESQQDELYDPQPVYMPYSPQPVNMYNPQPMEVEMYHPVHHHQSVGPADLIVHPQPVELYNLIEMHPEPPMEVCPPSAELSYPEEVDLYEPQPVNDPYCPQAVGIVNYQLVQYQPAPSRVTDPDSISESNDFFMYIFKVKQCPNTRSHHWPSCAFAHSGEKERRRNPITYHYYSDFCPSYRKKRICYYGNACNYAHGKFEHWLHPARYRTVYCREGVDCDRLVCFFAHSDAELRNVGGRPQCSCHYAPYANKEPVTAARSRSATNYGHVGAGSSGASTSVNMNAAAVSPKPSGENLNRAIDREATEEINGFKQYSLWG